MSLLCIGGCEPHQHIYNINMSAPAEPVPFVIPTIDISPYLEDPTSADSVKVIDNVRTACTTTGFFSLKGHGISRELKQRVFEAMKALFALPEDEKMKLKSPVLVTRGYELMRSQVLQEGTDADLKEVRTSPQRRLVC